MIARGRRCPRPSGNARVMQARVGARTNFEEGPTVRLPGGASRTVQGWRECDQSGRGVGPANAWRRVGCCDAALEDRAPWRRRRRRRRPSPRRRAARPGPASRLAPPCTAPASRRGNPSTRRASCRRRASRRRGPCPRRRPRSRRAALDRRRPNRRGRSHGPVRARSRGPLACRCRSRIAGL